MRNILFVLFLTLSSTSYSISLPIINDSVCQLHVNKLRNCDQLSIETDITSVADYIPLQTIISISKNSYCGTPYPIYLNLVDDIGDLNESFNIFTLSEIKINQTNSNSILSEIYSPYSVVAYYDSRCNISADIEANVVDVESLTSNLSDLKIEANNQLTLLDDLIDKQTLIIELTSVVDLYANVLDLAELELLDFYQLNDLIQNNCDFISDCTWTGQLQILLSDPDTPFSQFLLLLHLGSALDSLVPTDCTTGNCVASLIDPSTQEVIDDISNRIPGSEESTQALENYISQQAELLLLLSEYETVSSDYDIDWESL